MTKLVVRVLDASGRMLGGVVHHAMIPGDGTLRASGPVAVPITASGWPSLVSTHWCDVHTEVRVPIVGTPAVQVGATLTLAERGSVLMEVGAPPTEALEPLVVGHHVVAVPVGGIGARS